MSELGSFGAPSTATFGEESAKSEASSEMVAETRGVALPAKSEPAEESIQEIPAAIGPGARFESTIITAARKKHAQGQPPHSKLSQRVQGPGKLRKV